MEVIDPNPLVVRHENVPTLFRDLGLTYTDRLVVPESLDETLQATAEECRQIAYTNALVKDMSSYVPSLIKHRLLPRLSVSYIDEEIGFGVFAEEDITQFETIREYTGELRVLEEYDGSKYLTSYGPRSFWVNDAMVNISVDARKIGNESRYINHACKKDKFSFPSGTKKGRNVGFIPCFYGGMYHAIVIAIRDIEKGEELRMDYGEDTYWDGKGPKSSCFFIQTNKLLSLAKK